MSKRAIAIAASFLLGIVLCVCAFVLAAGGHGTYIPFALCASPPILLVIAFRGNAVAGGVGLSLAPLYWALLASVATQNRPNRRSLLAALLCAQYVGTPLLYWWSEEAVGSFATAIRLLPVWAGVFGALYIAAHVVLWRSVAKIQTQAASASA